MDNRAGRPGLVEEHGLALWIERDPLRALFDTGQGPALARNADALGVPLATARAVLLSHGHYDHTGGLAAVLRRAPQARVHAHPAALSHRYAGDGPPGLRPVGIPDDCRQALLASGRLVEVAGPAEVAEGLFLTGPVPRETGFEPPEPRFWTGDRGREPDPFEDDQAAWLPTPAGTCVLLGCSHAGVVNTLRQVRRLTGGRPLALVVGGMHLRSASGERLRATVQALRELDPARIVPTHCTGAAAVAALVAAFPDRVRPGRAGDVLEVG